MRPGSSPISFSGALTSFCLLVSTNSEILINMNRLNQKGSLDVAVVITLVVVIVVGSFVFLRVNDKSGDEENSIPAGALSESRLQEEFRCERIAADDLATDIYCSNYDLYLEHYSSDAGIVADFDDPRYTFANKQAVDQRTRSSILGGFETFTNERVSFDYPATWSINDEGTYIEILSDNFREIDGTSDAESEGSIFVWFFEEGISLDSYVAEALGDVEGQADVGDTTEINGARSQSLAGVTDGIGAYVYAYENTEGIGLMGYTHKIPVDKNNRSLHGTAEHIQEFEAVARSVRLF